MLGDLIFWGGTFIDEVIKPEIAEQERQRYIDERLDSAFWEHEDASWDIDDDDDYGVCTRGCDYWW